MKYNSIRHIIKSRPFDNPKSVLILNQLIRQQLISTKIYILVAAYSKNSFDNTLTKGVPILDRLIGYQLISICLQ